MAVAPSIWFGKTGHPRHLSSQFGSDLVVRAIEVGVALGGCPVLPGATTIRRHPMPSITPAVSGRRRSPLSEDKIHRAVVQHLKVRGRKDCVWLHCPNGGQRNKTEAARFVGLGVKPGVPDIMIIMDGSVYGLELKSDTGRLSPAQRAMHEQMRTAGATVETTRGLDDAIGQLETWGVLKC